MTTKITENEIDLNGVVYVKKSSIKNSSSPKLNGIPLTLIRSYGSGVHVGYITKRDDLLSGLKVTLANCRRIWYWDGANSLSQLAVDGINPSKISNCKFSCEVESMEITQVIEVIPVTAKAAESIKSVAIWKQ